MNTTEESIILICDSCSREVDSHVSMPDPRKGRRGDVCMDCLWKLESALEDESEIVALTAKLPDIETLHKAWCKKTRKRWKHENLMEDFKGNCNAVSLLLQEIVTSVKLRSVYGAYLGERKQLLNSIQHGWLVYNEEFIIDPTRFVFFDDPHIGIWIGRNNDPDYDEGAQRYNAHIRRQSGEILQPPKRKGPGEACSFSKEVTTLLEHHLPNRDFQTITMEEVHYLGRIGFDLTRDLTVAHTLYEALPKSLKGFIPLDVKRKAEFFAKK